MIGYTDNQARRMLDKIQAAYARLERDVEALAAIVPDCDANATLREAGLTDVRFRVAQLEDTVRRRVRT